MFYPYHAFLDGTGLKLGFLHVSWYTTAFNRTVYKWGCNSPRLIQQWFIAGCYITLVFLPISILIVLSSGISYFSPEKGQNTYQGPVLESAIPGVNLPISDLPYYLFSLVLSSVIHELGHALAAVREDVQLLSFGFHIVFIIPIAFVVMSTEQIHSLSSWRKLRIYSAGIWHNIVLASVAYLLLLSLPTLFGFLYQTNSGVQVLDVLPKSPLLGARGIEIENILTKIDDCNVNNKADWENCLLKVLSHHWGVCVSTDFVHKHDESVQIKHLNNGLLDCCEVGDGQNLCFEYLEPSHGVMELPQHMCLPVRKVLESSFEKCEVLKEYSCPNDHHCIKPILQNSTSLIIIKRKSKPDVLYIGHPFDIYQTVIVSQYIPKTKLLSSDIPEEFEKTLMYIIMFSLGLAIVNVFPCFVFDGQYVIQCIIHLLFVSKVTQTNLRNISFCVTLIGTILLVIVFGSMFWKQLF